MEAACLAPAGLRLAMHRSAAASRLLYGTGELQESVVRLQPERARARKH